MSLPFLFAAWQLEFGIHGALTMASTLLTAKSARNRHVLFWRAMFLAAVGFVISMAFAYMFDAGWIPMALGASVWVIRAVTSSTDPVGSAMLAMFMERMLGRECKEGADTSAKESVLNDVIASAVLGGILYSSLGVGLFGAGLGLALAIAAGKISARYESEYSKMGVVWIAGVLTTIVNMVLHHVGIHFEIAALTVTGFGGVFIIVFGGVHEEQKTLDFLEFAVMLVVSVMCLYNAVQISSFDPEMARKGGPYLMALRTSRVPYMMLGALGATTAFGGIPGIAVINLTATKEFENGNTALAAFLSGSSIWSVLYGIPLAIIAILIINSLKKAPLSSNATEEGFD